MKIINKNAILVLKPNYSFCKNNFNKSHKKDLVNNFSFILNLNFVLPHLVFVSLLKYPYILHQQQFMLFICFY